MGDSDTSIGLLFEPISIAGHTLSHRIVLSPLTRLRASQKGHVPCDFVPEYYAQRASFPGTLLVTEATAIASEAGGYDFIPGIWSEDQVAIWSKVTEAAHAKGSIIFSQLWALGRAGVLETLEEDGHPYVSSSATQLKERSRPPKEMTREEIKKYIGLYVKAAENAMRAGFDGVEVHGANGYLIDQFLQDVVNVRTDEYGGSIQNRSRFGLEVIKAIVDAVGEEKVAIRLSPWNRVQGMEMDDPIP